MRKLLSLFILAAFGLYAEDGWVGTWKLDLSRSEYKNVDAPGAISLVITHEGGYYILKTEWTDKGQVRQIAFQQPEKSGKITAVGNSAVAYGDLEVPNDHEWIYHYLTKDGKPGLSRRSKLSADGKTIEADSQGMMGGKMTVQHEILVKQ